jgi:hypothetical protein
VPNIFMLRGVRELALRPPGNLIHKVPNPARKGNMRAKDQWILTSLKREVFSFLTCACKAVPHRIGKGPLTTCRQDGRTVTDSCQSC